MLPAGERLIELQNQIIQLEEYQNQGGITAVPHFGGLHGGRTHFGSNQSSLWCRCQLCGIRTPTVTYKDVCCANCYRLPPRGERTWTIMKNCVWVKWARLTIQFLWLGKDHENNVRVAEARRIINYRDVRNTFFDAAETVGQMIEFGYISAEREILFGFSLQTCMSMSRMIGLSLMSEPDILGRYFLQIATLGEWQP